MGSGEKGEEEGENMNERMRIMEKSVCEPMKFRLYFSFCFLLFFILLLLPMRVSTFFFFFFFLLMKLLCKTLGI